MATLTSTFAMHRTIEGRSRIGVFFGQWHVENAARIYLERIRNSMQKPIEGLLTQRFAALNKGAIVFPSTTVRNFLAK